MNKGNQKNTILWIIGIIVLVWALSQLPVSPWFAIVTKTTCMDNTVSYWDMEGNVLGELGINNGVNYGGIFVSGRIGQAIEFNTTTYIDFPIISSENKTIVMWIKDSGSDWYFASETNGVSGTNAIIQLDSQFGLNFNGSIDEIAVFSPALTLGELSNLSIGRKVCYTVSYEENVSCKDFATEQVIDPGYGCLNYSGDFFPNCEYEWIDVSQYKIEDNECKRYFYCQSPCVNTTNCYLTNQTCIENLTYDCYIIENNKCIHKTDYVTCTGADYYSNLTACQANLTVGTTTPTTPTTPSTPGTFKDKLTEKVFDIAGYEITILHLIIALIVITGGLYFMGVFGKKK